METTPLKKKRKRIHQCSKCSFKQETKRTITHYFHLHLSKESIPFRCSLCGFKAMEEQTFVWETTSENSGKSTLCKTKPARQ